MGIVAIFICLVVAIVVITNVVKSAPSHEDTQRELAAKNAGVNASDILSEADKLLLLGEVMNQAKIVGDDVAYQKVMDKTYDGPWPEKRADGAYISLYDNLRILKIAGINYRQGISRYVGHVNCALVPEPNNEYDPNAIKIVAEDRHHLGYIPSEQTDMVRSLTGDTFPYRCEAHIYQAEDGVDGHRFFYGSVYIKRK